MKKHLLFILLFCAYHLQLLSQNSINMEAKAKYFDTKDNDTIINLADTSVLVIEIQKLTTGSSISSGYLSIEIKWGYGYSGSMDLPISGPWASLFDWYYIPAPGYTFGGWYGVNNVMIPDTGGKLEVRVLGNTPISNSKTQVSLQVNPPYSDPSPSNNHIFSGLTVQSSPLPIELLSFTANNSECGKIHLEWETANEIRNDYMELLRSENGQDFHSIGKIYTKQSRDMNKYKFHDPFVAESGKKYYYKIRQFDTNGYSTDHQTISILHQCNGDKLKFSVTPNPAYDKINIVTKGITKEITLDFNFIDAQGKIVRSISLPAIENNEIQLDDFLPGVYFIYEINQAEVSLQRFIKIK